jgi:hypothetical protein
MEPQPEIKPFPVNHYPHEGSYEHCSFCGLPMTHWQADRFCPVKYHIEQRINRAIDDLVCRIANMFQDLRGNLR